MDDLCPGVGPRYMPFHSRDVFSFGSIDFVDYRNICPSHVSLSGMIDEFISRPVGIEDDNLKIGPDERQIIVSPVPYDNVRLPFRALKYLRIIHPSIDNYPCPDKGLKFLPLFDRAVAPV